MRGEALMQSLSRDSMKRRILRKLGLGLALVLTIPLGVGCLQQSSASAESSSSVPRELQFVDSPQSTQTASAEEQLAENSISDAPVKPLSSEKSLPPNIRPTEALAGIIRLADSGVDESVMLSYVTSATGTFSLGPEEIIYLNDIGVPSSIITAMLQHDHLVVENAANAAPAPVAAPTTFANN